MSKTIHHLKIICCITEILSAVSKEEFKEDIKEPQSKTAFLLYYIL